MYMICTQNLWNIVFSKWVHSKDLCYQARKMTLFNIYLWNPTVHWYMLILQVFFNFQNKYVPYEPQDTNLIRSDMTNKHKRPHTFVYCIITACSSVLNIILRTCKYISFSANWIQRGSNALIHSKRYFFAKKIFISFNHAIFSCFS